MMLILFYKTYFVFCALYVYMLPSLSIIIIIIIIETMLWHPF